MFGKVNKATLHVTADYDHIYLELVYIDVDWQRSDLYPIYKQVEGMLEIEEAEVHIGWIRDHCHVTAALCC